MSGFLAILNGDGAPVDAALLRTSIDLPPFESTPELLIQGPFGVACSPMAERTSGAGRDRRRDAFLSDDRYVIAFDGRLDDRLTLCRQLAEAPVCELIDGRQWITL